MKVTRIATGPDGLTRFHDEEIPLVTSGTIGRLSALQPAAGVVFRETDASYDYDWHPTPHRQWVVLLDGEIEIETGDGATRRFGAGDILQLEDTAGRGHRTRQLSSGVRRSLFIPFD
jgi:hypothetical protein